jgi:DnaJ-class molecular chaperone
MERFGVSEAWDAFRHVYETAYSDAQRAKETHRQNQQAKPHRSPYDVLGVRESAPWPEIKSAYRKAMMELHPDRVMHTGIKVETAVLRTQEVNAAYVELENRRGAI